MPTCASRIPTRNNADLAEHSIIRAVAVMVATIIAEIHVGSGVVAAMTINSGTTVRVLRRRRFASDNNRGNCTTKAMHRSSHHRNGSNHHDGTCIRPPVIIGDCIGGSTECPWHGDCARTSGSDFSLAITVEAGTPTPPPGNASALVDDSGVATTRASNVTAKTRTLIA